MTKESQTVYILQAIATDKKRKTYSDMGEYESLEEVKEAMKEESYEWREKGKKSKLTFSIQIKAKRKGETPNENHNRNSVKKMEKTDK